MKMIRADLIIKSIEPLHVILTSNREELGSRIPEMRKDVTWRLRIGLTTLRIWRDYRGRLMVEYSQLLTRNPG